MDQSGDKIEWKAVSEVVGRDWKVSDFFAGCLQRRVTESIALSKSCKNGYVQGTVARVNLGYS